MDNQKDILMLNELYKRYNSGYSDFDDTKELIQNSSNDRIQYLLEVCDAKMRFEIIVCMLSELPLKRNIKLLNPYTEYLKFIKGLKQGISMEAISELYFLAQEQIKTKYVPIGSYEISKLI